MSCHLFWKAVVWNVQNAAVSGGIACGSSVDKICDFFEAARLRHFSISV